MDGWVWSNGGMILTGENWSTGRKTYSVGGRWMDEFRTMLEWYWEGKTEVMGELPLPLSLFPTQVLPGIEPSLLDATVELNWIVFKNSVRTAQ